MCIYVWLNTLHILRDFVHLTTVKYYDKYCVAQNIEK